MLAEDFMCTFIRAFLQALPWRERLRGVPDTVLLKELVQRNGTIVGPRQVRYFEPVNQTIVAIGKDHTASIYLHADDFQALQAITAAEAQSDV